MTTYWKLLNFLVRRVVATGFVAVGLLVAATGLPGLLPGGSVQVNGAPSDDMVLRVAVVLLPLLVSALGLALYRVRPYEPGGHARRSSGDA
jgi:hypothetical protein